MFLKCRAEELVIGGRMVLTSSARTCEDRITKECCYAWEFLNLALNDMVTQVQIKVNTSIETLKKKKINT